MISQNNKNCCSFMGDKKFSITVYAFIIILAVFLLASAAYKVKMIESVRNENTITILGEGEVYAKPDLAIADFSVVNEALTVEKAVSDNAEKMNSVIKALKEKGIDDKDVKTTTFYLSPRYEYKQTETEIMSYPSSKRVLVGYELTQGIEVKIRDLSKIGAIIESATNSGANEVGDLQLKIDKDDDFKKQARESAIKDAKEKASELAKQVGIKLGKIVNFSESNAMPVYYDSQVYGKGGGEATSSIAPSIQPGQNKITSVVSITYEIK